MMEPTMVETWISLFLVPAWEHRLGTFIRFHFSTSSSTRRTSPLVEQNRIHPREIYNRLNLKKLSRRSKQNYRLDWQIFYSYVTPNATKSKKRTLLVCWRASLVTKTEKSVSKEKIEEFTIIASQAHRQVSSFYL